MGGKCVAIRADLFAPGDCATRWMAAHPAGWCTERRAANLGGNANKHTKKGGKNVRNRLHDP